MESDKQVQNSKNSISFLSGTFETLRQTVVVCLWGLLILLCFLYRDHLTIESIVNYSPADPLLAVLVLLCLFAVKSITLFVYCGILYAASGVLFDFPFSVLVNQAGTFLMMSIPYYIGKRAGIKALTAMVQKNSKLRLLQTSISSNEFFLSFLVRILGLLPSDLVGMFMGASGLRYSRYLLGSMLGMLPTTITFAVMGMSVQDIRSPEFLISAGIELALMVFSAVIYALWQHSKKGKQTKA